MYLANMQKKSSFITLQLTQEELCYLGDCLLLIEVLSNAHKEIGTMLCNMKYEQMRKKIEKALLHK